MLFWCTTFLPQMLFHVLYDLNGVPDEVPFVVIDILLQYLVFFALLV
jgi:hypothetical protein